MNIQENFQDIAGAPKVRPLRTWALRIATEKRTGIARLYILNGLFTVFNNRSRPERRRVVSSPTMRYKVLIIEEDIAAAQGIAEAVRAAGYEAEIATDAILAITQGMPGGFDVVLLGVDDPGKDGLGMCHRLRECDVDRPILIVSAQSEVSHKLTAFQSGADDYISKPFDMRELLARIQALLRRTISRSIRSLRTCHFGDVIVDFVAGTVTKNGTPVALSGKELYLLRYLIARRDSVVSREELLTEVWGYRTLDTRTVDMHVALVRRKLEDDPQQPRFIITMRRKGYQFCACAPVPVLDQEQRR